MPERDTAPDGEKDTEPQITEQQDAEQREQAAESEQEAQDSNVNDQTRRGEERTTPRE